MCKIPKRQIIKRAHVNKNHIISPSFTFPLLLHFSFVFFVISSHWLKPVSQLTETLASKGY